MEIVCKAGKGQSGLVGLFPTSGSGKFRNFASLFRRHFIETGASGFSGALLLWCFFAKFNDLVKDRFSYGDLVAVLFCFRVSHATRLTF